MLKKTAIVEDFDDDTDLPLPNQPLPNTGALGPLLEQLSGPHDNNNNNNNNNSDDDDSDPSYQQAGPASPPRPLFQPRSTSARREPTVDSSTYKTWTCIYPIYLDAKRPYGTGQRRVERAKSLWWPLSKDIADAANRLGLGTLHEVSKSHPRDWENPGRVRVQWKKDGRLVNPMIKSKKQLLETICFQIHILKPENVPKPPYNLATPNEPSPPVSKSAGGPNKGKQTSTSSKPIKTTTVNQKQQSGRRLPVPPEPLPPLTNRVSAYSPAVSTGILVEAVKAGMNNPDNAGLLPGAGGSANMQKGKRKVVRVRG